MAREIVREPRGEAYRRLLAAAVQKDGAVALVWRRQIQFGESAARVGKELQRWLLREEETDSWPGTKLLESTAIVRFYSAVPEVMDVLGNADGLYSWLAPDRPEDLSLWNNGACYLGSIAHEQEAWVHPERVPKDVAAEMNELLEE